MPVNMVRLLSLIISVTPTYSLHVARETETAVVPIPDSAKKLVFDIGMNRGDDTAAYLKAGYNVVAVEPNPVWAKANAKLFEKEIKDGSLIIVNAAVASSSGSDLDFFVPRLKKGSLGSKLLKTVLKKTGVCDSLSATGSSVQGESGGCEILDHVDEWASFNRSHACGYHKQRRFECESQSWLCYCDKVPVSTVSCKDLVEKYGQPLMMKVDIEGYDGFCMKSLAELPCKSMPRFVSFEEQSQGISAQGGSSKEIIDKLSPHGYSWKVQRQKMASHTNIGSGPFGEDAVDFVKGKEWSGAANAQSRANIECWDPKYMLWTYLCDVHGKHDQSVCEAARG